MNVAEWLRKLGLEQYEPAFRENKIGPDLLASLELRTSTSYARLTRDQGRAREACEPLAPVYGRFTEGFHTKDLKDAKALLDELTAERVDTAD